MTTGANKHVPQRTYVIGDVVKINGLDMHFSHYVVQDGKDVPFFHYYVDGKQFGYIKHDSTREI
jgi:hypothetical protein